jgi:Flp pilus assembly protein TadG
VAAFIVPSPSSNKRHEAQAVIEFALIVPVLLIMLLGMIDLGRAFVFGVSVQNGAREAARLAERAATDVNVTDSAVFSRLITASNPALIGCSATAGSQQCGGGTWNFTINVTTPNGTAYTSLASAKADTNFPDSKVQVTAVGTSISLFAGFQTSWGLSLSPFSVQGQAAMVVL